MAARRSLAVPLAPSSGTPPIRGVPNIGRSASSKHKTETTGMSAPVTPVWWNVLRATRTAAAWRVTESNSLDRSRPLTMSCSRTGTKALAYLADLLSVARQRTGLSWRAGQKRA